MNTQVIFQPYIDPNLQPYMEDIAVCSMHVILLYTTNQEAMIPPVQQRTSPDRVRPSPVQSSPSNF